MSYIDGKPIRREPHFIWLFLGKCVLLALTIVIVWLLYAYLVAFRLDWLGWFYTKLFPFTPQVTAVAGTALRFGSDHCFEDFVYCCTVIPLGPAVARNWPV